MARRKALIDLRPGKRIIPMVHVERLLSDMQGRGEGHGERGKTPPGTYRGYSGYHRQYIEVRVTPVRKKVGHPENKRWWQ